MLLRTLALADARTVHWAPEAGGASRGDRSVARERPAAYTTTRRWLRGRILDRLREVEGDGWAAFSGPIGEHDGPAVVAALRTLASEGMIELESGGRTGPADPPPAAGLRARLPAR